MKIQDQEFKVRPKRKNVFVRFEKFWKHSKFDFRSRKGNSKKFGVKKFKILLIFIFLMIDQKNKIFENDLGLPTNLEIANFVGCHESWVKQVKCEFFGSKSNMTNEQKEVYRKHLGLVYSWERIFGYKDMLIAKNEQLDEEVIDPWKNSCVLKTKTKAYLNWMTRKDNFKRFVKFKFFRYCYFDFDDDFDRALSSNQNQKAKKNFVWLIFKNNQIWHKFGWFWKVVFWLRENFEIFLKKKNNKISGIVWNW